MPRYRALQILAVATFLFSVSAETGVPAPQQMLELDFGNGVFLATGPSEVFAVSPDALHWRRFRSEFSAQYVKTSFLEDEFGALVGTAKGTLLATSPDGIEWTIRIPPRKEALTALVKAKGMYVAAGFLDSGNGVINGAILTSTNGTEWQTKYTAPLPVYGLAYGNSVFVAACGHEGGIFSSDDATTWTQRMPKTTGAYQAATFGDGRFVAVGFERESFPQPNEMASSSDGITWERRYAAAQGGILTQVCYGLGLFVASGGRVRTISSDGLSWEGTTLESAWNALAFGNGKFVALSVDDGVHVSADGRNWQRAESANLYAPSLTVSTSTTGEAGVNVVLSGRPGKEYALEVSADFVSWQSITTGTSSISNSVTLTGERNYLRGKLVQP